jgi:hypothetical protein
MPRPFYIIAHNPNSADEAVLALVNGANALEPDVFWDGKDFRIEEHWPGVLDSVYWLFASHGPTLAEYLHDLVAGLSRQAEDHPLALIAFDLKNPSVQIVTQLMKEARALARSPELRRLNEVSLLYTVGSPDEIQLIAGATLDLDEAVGVDEGTDVSDAEIGFAHALVHTYGRGTSLGYTTYAKSMAEAVRVRDQPNSRLRLVYPWTINLSATITSLLTLEVDGMITDEPGRLKAIAQSAGRTLATDADKPFRPSGFLAAKLPIE